MRRNIHPQPVPKWPAQLFIAPNIGSGTGQRKKKKGTNSLFVFCQWNTAWLLYKQNTLSLPVSTKL
jgi:hypothetical protein